MGVKKGDMVPCVISAQSDDTLRAGIMEVFHRISTELSPKAPLFEFGADCGIDPLEGRFKWRFKSEEFTFPAPNLMGDHQFRNIGAALTVLRLIEPDLFDPEKLSTAMGQINWPGRLQKLAQHPFCTLLPEGSDLLLDGGHNEDAALILADQAARWAKQGDLPLDLVVAMVRRKDPAAFLKPLLPYTRSLSLTTIEGEEEMYAPENLAETAHNLGFTNISTAPDPQQAIHSISKQLGNTPSRVLICGSLYLAGDVLRQKTV